MLKRKFFIILLLVLVFIGLNLSWCMGKVKIPKPIGKGTFINDYAGIISPSAKEKIGKIQEKAFNEYDTPIMIVTLKSNLSVSDTPISIEELAKKWFDTWEIGKKDAQGRTINQGILILVLLEQRKVRIELGGEWGHKWDKYCKTVIEDYIIPNFKKGDYSRGLYKAVKALGGMAEKGPYVDPPSTTWIEKWVKNPESAEVPTSPIKGLWLVLLTALGAVLLIGSFFVPQKYKGPMLIAGIALLVIALLTWVIVFILAMLGRGRGFSSGGGFGTGGFSGGGGFGTGGFSGGGGATGSW